jgi:hypothetical protein
LVNFYLDLTCGNLPIIVSTDSEKRSQKLTDRTPCGLRSEKDCAFDENYGFYRHIEKTGVSLTDNQLSCSMRIFERKERDNVSFALLNVQ